MSLVTFVFWTLLSMSTPLLSPLPDGWIDRVEGDTAVLVLRTESGSFQEVSVPLIMLPIGTEEGDCIVNGRIDDERREQVLQRVLRAQREMRR